MKKLLNLILLFVFLITSSCGGQPGTQSASEAYNQISLASLLLLNLRLNSNSSSSLNNVSKGMGNRPTSFAFATSCATKNPTTPIDADGDGISLYANYAYDCNSDSPVTSIFSGTLEMFDLDDNVDYLLGGYRYLWNFNGSYESVADPVSGGVNSIAEYNGKGNWSGVKSGNDLIMSGTYSGAYKVKEDTGKLLADYTYDGEYTYKITPQTATESEFYKKGSSSMSGKWIYTGLFQNDDHHHGGGSSSSNSDLTIFMKTENVTYDSVLCPTHYWRTGTFTMDVGGGSIFKAVYNCTSVTYYFNGKIYDPSAT